MPFEDGNVNAKELYSQLSVIESIMEQNADCLVICSGDFNADFLETGYLQNFLVTSVIVYLFVLLTIMLAVQLTIRTILICCVFKQ